MAVFSAPRPQMREESPEVKAAWTILRQKIRSLDLVEEQTFGINAVITGIAGDPNNPDQPIWKEIEKQTNGVKRKELAPHLTLSIKLTEPGLEAITFTKTARINFFDGHMRGRAERSPFRGFFYWVHYAATGSEPSPALVSGATGFDPDDYVGKPLKAILVYKGRVPADSQYYGRTANITVFVDKLAPLASSTPDDDDDDGYAAAPAPTPVEEKPWVDDATDPHGAMAEVMGHKQKKAPKQAALTENMDDDLDLPL
jgi:hypothetical protein